VPLTDDIGLGQTVQVIALLLLGRRARADPSLLVLSASLSGNWQAHVGEERFAPDLCVLVALRL
jgi:SNF2 family DNA or RNA helicase